jgi:large subunit ribosomal protein L4
MTMASIDVLKATGKKAGSRQLAADIFESRVSIPLMHQVVLAGLAGLRAGTHSTKTRGEVSGGGKKPWRQKGTGRARQGSIRSPQWVGGGVSHGPQPRSHAMHVNKKMRKGALRSALTDALQSGKLMVVEDLTFEAPRTKQAVELIEALELKGKILLVLPEPTKTGAIEKSFRNLTDIEVAYAPGLGTYHVLWADRVVFTAAALDRLQGETSATIDAPSMDTPDADADEAPAEEVADEVTP